MSFCAIQSIVWFQNIILGDFVPFLIKNWWAWLVPAILWIDKRVCTRSYKHTQIELRLRLLRRGFSGIKTTTPCTLLLVVVSLTYTHTHTHTGRYTYLQGMIQYTKLHRDQTISDLTTEIVVKIGSRWWSVTEFLAVFALAKPGNYRLSYGATCPPLLKKLPCPPPGPLQLGLPAQIIHLTSAD